jgi:hypothetical protein
VETLNNGSNTLFILLGAVRVLAMHTGFACLEVDTVRRKNQVKALVKIISEFAVSAYFFIDHWIAYGVTFLEPASVLPAHRSKSGLPCAQRATSDRAIPDGLTAISMLPGYPISSLPGRRKVFALQTLPACVPEGQFGDTGQGWRSAAGLVWADQRAEIRPMPPVRQPHRVRLAKPGRDMAGLIRIGQGDFSAKRGSILPIRLAATWPG